MINKIQQYLLLNYPIVWNTKFVPTMFIVLGLYVLFFAVGYFIIDTSIELSLSGSYALTYAGCMLTCTLLFIMWVIDYNKNNALKVYYRQSTRWVFLEWFMVFIICVGIGFVPSGLTFGKSARWAKAVPNSVTRESVNILQRAKVLLPSDIRAYEIDDRRQNPMLIGNADVDKTQFHRDLYSYEESVLTPEPIEYIGPSLLYYKDNHYNTEWDYNEIEVAKVHQWLQAQQKDSIEKVMADYLALQKRHGLEGNLDLDTWMKIIYNPPFYPVADEIQTSDWAGWDDNKGPVRYTSFDNLTNFYSHVSTLQAATVYDLTTIVTTISIALVLSLFVFSNRLTTGKSWIYALVIAGVLMFISSLFYGFIALAFGSLIAVALAVPGFWLTVIAILIGFIISKLIHKRNKGRTNIFVNLAMWLVPAIIPLFYYTYLVLMDEIEGALEKTLTVAIINLVIVIISMYPISAMLRRWKALPED